MVTRLQSPLKREIAIAGEPYVLTLTPTGFLLTQKGRRKGYEMEWSAFVSGEAALATALNASIANAPPARKPKSSQGQDGTPRKRGRPDDER